MRTHQKPGLKGLETTAEGGLEEAAGGGGGRVEQALHEVHAGCGVAGAHDVEDLPGARDVLCVITGSTRPSMH